MSKSLRDLREQLDLISAPLKSGKKSLSEQFDPQSIARQIEDALYQAGWRFTTIDVPSKARGDIVIQGIQNDQFIDVTVTYTDTSADVEVAIGRTSRVEGVTDEAEIVKTIQSLVGGERPAESALREKQRTQGAPDHRMPAWLRDRDRPRSVGAR